MNQEWCFLNRQISEVKKINLERWFFPFFLFFFLNNSELLGKDILYSWRKKFKAMHMLCELLFFSYFSWEFFRFLWCIMQGCGFFIRWIEPCKKREREGKKNFPGQHFSTFFRIQARFKLKISGTTGSFQMSNYAVLLLYTALFFFFFLENVKWLLVIEMSLRSGTTQSSSQSNTIFCLYRKK